MTQRLKALLPLSGAVGLLAFLWLEVSLNFSFHWVSDGDLGIGLALPASFHLVPPAAFVSWAMFFAAGGDRAAAVKVAIASAVGAGGGLVLMWVAPSLAGLPDFWGIAVTAGVLALIVTAAGCVEEWYFIPAAFGGFATIVFWWIATGMDGWAEAGGGVGNSVDALARPETAGSGAFGGVLSTPVLGVFGSCLASLVCGVVLGLVSAWIAGLLTSVLPGRKPEAVRTAPTA
jgi:hypothetical protein